MLRHRFGFLRKTKAGDSATQLLTNGSSSSISPSKLAATKMNMDGNFQLARKRVVPSLDEREWQGDFTFIQLADPQFGMLNNNDSWEVEVEFLSRAIQVINVMQPMPRFVVVCGDLVNAFPDKDTKQKGTQAEQVKDFKAVVSQLRPEIVPVCVCGNHDIGDKPTPETISLFRSRFGDDYFEFRVGGVQFIVLNTSLYWDGSLARDEFKKQDTWLSKVLGRPERDNTPPVHRVIFSHIPPFIYKPDEPNGYFNLNTHVRANLLSRVMEAGVTKWFCGHYHRNAGGNCGGLEVVVTGAVGCNIEDDGKDPLGLKGITKLFCETATSGFRVVTVRERMIEHQWVTLDDIAPVSKRQLPFSRPRAQTDGSVVSGVVARNRKHSSNI